MHRKPEVDLVPLDTKIERTLQNLDHSCRIQKYGKSKRKIAGYSRRRIRSREKSEA